MQFRLQAPSFQFPVIMSKHADAEFERFLSPGFLVNCVQKVGWKLSPTFQSLYLSIENVLCTYFYLMYHWGVYSL